MGISLLDLDNNSTSNSTCSLVILVVDAHAISCGSDEAHRVRCRTSVSLLKVSPSIKNTSRVWCHSVASGVSSRARDQRASEGGIGSRLFLACSTKSEQTRQLPSSSDTIRMLGRIKIFRTISTLTQRTTLRNMSSALPIKTYTKEAEVAVQAVLRACHV